MGRRNKVEKGEARGRKKEVNLAMIAANNHYAGFGPGTANLFRKMVGLPELSWENQNQLQERLELRKRLLRELEQDQKLGTLLKGLQLKIDKAVL
jgi:hypothetical protein